MRLVSQAKVRSVFWFLAWNGQCDSETCHTTRRHESCAPHTNHRNFALVTYDNLDDAKDAVDNLHNAELCGRTISVALASAKLLTHAASRHRPVWETDDADAHQLADEPAAAEAVVVTDRYAKMASTNAR